MKQSPIMDHKGFVYELESIYQNMWENYLKQKMINLILIITLMV